MKKLLLSIFTFLFISVTAFSQVYVDQITGFSDAGGRPAQIFPDFTMCALETADDFTVPAGAYWSIDSVFTVGSFSATTGGSFDSVIVTFYNDNSGVPGTVRATDTVALPTTQTTTSLAVVLNQTITLGPGTYWITVNVVMNFTMNGQWFQGAFGSTALGSEWNLRDPCDLLATGNTGWQSSTSLVGGTKDMMFKLVSGAPCTTVVDVSTAVLDATITSYQLSAGYQWIDCSNNAFMVNDTNRIFTAPVNGDYACIIHYDCAVDTTNCVSITCIEAIDNTVSVNMNTITSNDATVTSYQWLDCDNGNSPISGETNISFTAAASGNYACELTKGCSPDTTTCTNIIFNGINNLVSDFNINVFPNPTKGILTIETGILKIKEVNVLSLTGELIITTTLTNENINVSALPVGIYLLEVITKDGKGYSKFIKE